MLLKKFDAFQWDLIWYFGAIPLVRRCCLFVVVIIVIIDDVVIIIKVKNQFRPAALSLIDIAQQEDNLGFHLKLFRKFAFPTGELFVDLFTKLICNSKFATTINKISSNNHRFIGN